MVVLNTKASAGKKRHVLIIVQNLPVPFDRRVWLESTTLIKAGYQISVICPKGKGFDKSYERLEGADIYRYALPIDAQGPLGYFLEFGWCFFRTFLKSIQVAVRGGRFDAIHACNPPETYWLLALFWRPFGTRFLFDHHDLSPEMFAAKFGRTSGLLYRGLLFLERMTFKTADHVITTNESHKTIAVERGGKEPDDVTVVRSGPALERLKKYPADQSWRNGCKHLIVYLGEICEQDGVDHLIRAVKILRDQLGRDDVHCVIVGGGPHQPAIAAYAEEVGVADSCTFTGRVSDDELCRILSSADLGVDPDPKTDWSDKSTMNKIMEYMYFGLPIVAYELKENKFSAQEAAVYAEPNSEQSLAENISRLLNDSERRAAMSAYGMDRLTSQLSWEHSIPQLLAAYDRLSRQPRPRLKAEVKS
jgi:glycosyltransferase involved in cell wall biosynthesis